MEFSFPKKVLSQVACFAKRVRSKFKMTLSTRC